MTEELKQKAIENVCKRNPFVEKEWFIGAFKKYDKGERVNYLKDYEIDEYESYIAGAIENGIQWHDLRKDPNDLPKDSGLFIIHWKVGTLNHYMIYKGTIKEPHKDVIAWCEIPQFKE